MKKTLAIWLFIFFIPTVDAGPAACILSLSTAEGLSDNNVTIAVRFFGNLWIAYTKRLNSFDGNRITTYHKYKHPELPDNNIERILW
ncbi:MAG: hypothetical protein IPK57_17985 [Chitinophagaceae bacterium]|nr:hypothetical protein [Chitinophagaceae bacterium]